MKGIKKYKNRERKRGIKEEIKKDEEIVKNEREKEGQEARNKNNANSIKKEQLMQERKETEKEERKNERENERNQQRELKK